MAGTCKQCGVLVHSFNNQMVMLKDEIWLHVNNHLYSGVLCISCIEERLGRVIRSSDLKKGDDGSLIPVNIDFARQRNINY